MPFHPDRFAFAFDSDSGTSTAADDTDTSDGTGISSEFLSFGRSGVDAGGSELAAEIDDDIDDDGTDGADSLTGGSGDDSLNGGAGDDTLVGSRGSDTLIGGDGNDTADYSDLSHRVTFDVEDGEVYKGRGDVDEIDGVETIIGGDSDHNTIDAGAEDYSGDDDDADEDQTISIDVDLSADTLTVHDSADGSDTTYSVVGFQNVVGTDNADSITGDDDDNRLRGGAGDDTIAGGDGENVLTGGDDADTFVHGSGTDVITDFDSDEGDQIEISSSIDEIEDEDCGAVVTFADGSSVTLVGFDSSDVDTGWFV